MHYNDTKEGKWDFEGAPACDYNPILAFPRSTITIILILAMFIIITTNSPSPRTSTPLSPLLRIHYSRPYCQISYPHHYHQLQFFIIIFLYLAFCLIRMYYLNKVIICANTFCGRLGHSSVVLDGFCGLRMSSVVPVGGEVIVPEVSNPPRLIQDGGV